MKAKIHYKAKSATACGRGLASGVLYSSDWSDVTCKQCRKHKKEGY